MRISRTENMTNIEVLRRMGKEKELVITDKCRKLQYLGHILCGTSAGMTFSNLLLTGK